MAMNSNTKTSREDVFRELPVPSALRAMILPAVTSQLIVLIYNMADTFYVGQTNNPYMVAGTSLILPVFNITLCLAGLAGIGGGALISRLLGQGREEEARRTGTLNTGPGSEACRGSGRTLCGRSRGGPGPLVRRALGGSRNREMGRIL